MRVLLVHNEYVYAGGEDAVATAEGALLQSYGHEVRRVIVSNRSINRLSDKLLTAWQAPYSGRSRRQMDAHISEFDPDVVHVHNFFPILTPSIYDACTDAAVPVVQTLHNYRLF